MTITFWISYGVMNVLLKLRSFKLLYCCLVCIFIASCNELAVLYYSFQFLKLLHKGSVNVFFFHFGLLNGDLYLNIVRFSFVMAIYSSVFLCSLLSSVSSILLLSSWTVVFLSEVLSVLFLCARGKGCNPWCMRSSCFWSVYGRLLFSRSEIVFVMDAVDSTVN